MKLVFDLGLYDGADTAHYLAQGFRVVAVDANPNMIEGAKRRFADSVTSGRLTCLHRALTADGEAVDLVLSASDAGSSSIIEDRIAQMNPSGRFRVEGITLAHLCSLYGVPWYLKVDLEGADRFAILGLSDAIRPDYVSFEIGEDADELLAHLNSVGYRRFKIINQNTFREADNVACLQDRIANRVIRMLGFAEPRLIRRNGSMFVAGTSSGPVPEVSDGRWRGFAETRARLHATLPPGWNDIHASLR